MREIVSCFFFFPGIFFPTGFPDVGVFIWFLYHAIGYLTKSLYNRNTYIRVLFFFARVSYTFVDYVQVRVHVFFLPAPPADEK